MPHLGAAAAEGPACYEFGETYVLISAEGDGADDGFFSSLITGFFITAICLIG
jgi:hypothetical protein